MCPCHIEGRRGYARAVKSPQVIAGVYAGQKTYRLKSVFFACRRPFIFQSLVKIP
ncbi:hypothetical protein COLINT_02970 [Collinsella intestinalis DSM 13280]|uniref:Uncharacterized protein n=1 Tax=Collinsella intestinalis DSM 13280 TaxID=521003 RepID=C4FA78_9ACTN|nr:hypothetical protein COLINT_02970 [Collinsella intestinalis DSM 13280]